MKESAEAQRRKRLTLAARKSLGRRIRLLRKENGLSQAELGERAGLHHTFLSHVERAEKEPSFGTLWAIADALGISVSRLTDA